MSSRKRPAQQVCAPSPLPSVLDLGRQIVRLSNKHDEMCQEQISLKRQGSSSWDDYKRDGELERLMKLSFDRECSLVDIALGMRARTLGDVAVMLALAWRVADNEDACEKDEKSLEQAFRQIKHALLTSLDVIIKEAGLDLDETVGRHTQVFIDREHADLGDGL